MESDDRQPYIVWRHLYLRVVSCWDDESGKRHLALERRAGADLLGATRWERADQVSVHALAPLLGDFERALDRSGLRDEIETTRMENRVYTEHEVRYGPDDWARD